MDTIQKNTVATIQYSLQTVDGRSIDRDSRIAYIHGHNNLLSGMEKALEGKKIGDTIEIQIAPADGYGEYLEQEPIRVHQKELGTDFHKLVKGMPLHLQNSNGDTIVIFVKEKEGAYAQFTRNHPLAGVPLLFNASITDIRCAQPEEISKKMAYEVDSEISPTCGCC